MEHIESTDGFAARLLGCRTLVLDEVDQLLETGFQRNIEFIISKLPPSKPLPGHTGRQTLAFSATVPARLLTTLKMALNENHIVVDCVGETDVDTHDKILQSVLIHPLEQSLFVLHHTLMTEMQDRPNDYKIMCFLPTARSAQFLTAVLTEMGIDVMEIHSRKNQAQRTLVRRHAHYVIITTAIRYQPPAICSFLMNIRTFISLSSLFAPFSAGASSVRAHTLSAPYPQPTGLQHLP